MKGTFSLVLLLCVLAASASRAGESIAPTDQELMVFTQQRTNAVRVTDKPVKMSLPSAVSCKAYSQTELKEIQNSPHFEKYAHVYVSPNGELAMHTHTNNVKFPVGAIVLKEKFSDATAKSTELFTGMVKREAGYNPECGDWEFFTVSADAKRITSRGKLQNCMDCHEQHEYSDFVTKQYQGMIY